MAKFNKAKSKNTRKTLTHEGGVSYKKSLDNEWSNFIFSCLMNSGFYESSDEQQKRYEELTEEMIKSRGIPFVCNAAVYSRNELGMRSISSLTAAILNKYDFESKRKFYSSFFHRPDDVAEVFAAIDESGGKRSHALIRGAGDYLSTLDAYQLMKYHMNGNTYNMHDLVNITHPKSSSNTLTDFVYNKLDDPDTWEQRVQSEKSEARRAEEFKRLVEEGKMGYLALIRNLRRIISTVNPDREWRGKYLNPQLENPHKIEKSLVFPYQIYQAWCMARNVTSPDTDIALENAMVIALDNIPSLDGKTLIVMDVSASMEDTMGNSRMSILETCAVYAAGFLMKNPDNTDIIKFGSKAKFAKLPTQSYLKAVEQLQNNDYMGYSTEMDKVFDILDKTDTRYDRMILFSDMQVMGQRYGCYSTNGKSINKRYRDYCKSHGKTHIYSFDLGNYKDQVVSEDKDITYITALNPTIFKVINLMESGKTLVDLIEGYEY